MSRLKSQSSLEYLLIIAITFAIIVPATYLFYNYSKESGNEISDAQITKLGRGIVDSADSIYYTGYGAKTTLEINVPDGVKAAQIIDGRELIFNISTDAGISEIIFFSRANISTTPSNCIVNNCTFPEIASQGLKNVKIEAITQSSVRIEVI